MKCLLLHAKEYQIHITGLATRPMDVRPEPVKEAAQKIESAIVAWITVEENDEERLIERVVEDLKMFARETGRQAIVLVPFAHLSNQLAPSEKALELFAKLESALRDHLYVERTHFGSDKELQLHLFGHPGNVRFRQYS